ncbi:heme utilization cystosolic carrier protein HutX [Campylobacter geochelonis]|uniref:HuvX protein n=1 Tax=Campylobacter geochelonis TaxID=1780362 RepID=A0A128EE10_9BACT|nr:heme utilization cystosolic carrier protein HutX [Campylobacter geochelonis]QKF72091.1 putative heme iron utilization protein, ChuX/HutX family [Campylobacter geochelonis]CZE45883.1 HuvX protein [Campylobacter geochelonis]CZE46751.1 HuvX protein [Campylobacter geochelonis]
MENLENKVAELFKDEKMSVLQAASQLNVNECEILRFKSLEEFKEICGSHLSEVLQDIASWGEVMFCKNTPEFIIEFKTKIDEAKKARGYYNFCGKSGFLGGHLKEEAVASIGFVSTKFMGLLGHSIHFYSAKNETIFKIYLSRDEKRELDKAQVEKFLALKERF